jgi:copper(I)-binding protein
MTMMKRGLALLATCALGSLGSVPVQAAIEADAGWSRQTPPGITVGVGYFTLKNTGSKTRELLKITAPQAAAIEIDRTSTDAQGVTRMWPVGKLEIAPGQTVKLAPNGLHIMLRGLKQPLLPGQTVPVTMLFADEPPVTVVLRVRALSDVEGAGPAADTHAMHDMPMDHDHH